MKICAVKLDSTIRLAERTVFALDDKYRLTAFDADTGAARGKTASEDFTSGSIDHTRMVTFDDMAFTTAGTPMSNVQKRFFAFDGQTGKVKWYVKVDGNILYSRIPAAIDMQTGKTLWETKGLGLSYYVGVSDQAVYGMYAESEPCPAFN